jgi:hypothetical protein
MAGLTLRSIPADVAGRCGRWKDDRGWKEIADDVVRRRTVGRKVAL